MPENNTALCSTFKSSGQNKTIGQENKTNHSLEGVCVKNKNKKTKKTPKNSVSKFSI